MYNAGHSLYCRSSEALESLLVPTLLEELSYGPSNHFCPTDRYSRGEIETFFTRKGHMTGSHTDFQENFTIQLTGVKKWKFRRLSTAAAPLRGCTPHFSAAGTDDIPEMQLKVHRIGDSSFQADQYKDDQYKDDEIVSIAPKKAKGKNVSKSSKGHNAERNEDKDVYEVVLHAGDVLYHPAGVWHQVECLEDSIAINISLSVISYADVACSALQQMMWKNPVYRAPIRCSRLSDEEYFQMIQPVRPSPVTSNKKARLSTASSTGAHLAAARNRNALEITQDMLDTLANDIISGRIKAVDILPPPSFGVVEQLSGLDEQKQSGDHSDENDDNSDDNEDSADSESSDSDGSDQEECSLLRDSRLLKVSQVNPPEAFNDMTTRLRYSFNPVAELLRAKDLRVLGWTAIDEDIAALEDTVKTSDTLSRKRKVAEFDPLDGVYVSIDSEEQEIVMVHTGFANEGMESLTRRVLAIPKDMLRLLDVLLEMKSEEPVEGELRPCFSLYTIRTALPDGRWDKLMYALVLAGFITIL